ARFSSRLAALIGLENRFRFLFGNAWPCIDHTDVEHAIVAFAAPMRPEMDKSLGRIAHGIDEEVVSQPPQTCPVALDFPARNGGKLAGERQPLFFRSQSL